MSILIQDVLSFMQFCRSINYFPASYIGTIRGGSRTALARELATVFEASEGLTPAVFEATLEMRNEQDQAGIDEGSEHGQDNGLSDDARDAWVRAEEWASVLHWIENEQYKAGKYMKDVFPPHPQDTGLYGSVLNLIKENTSDLSEAEIEDIEARDNAAGVEARQMFATCERMKRFIKQINEDGTRLISKSDELREPENLPNMIIKAVGNEIKKYPTKRVKGHITGDQYKALSERFDCDKALAQAY